MRASANINIYSFSNFPYTALTYLTDCLALSPMDDTLILAIVSSQYTERSSIFSMAAYCSTVNVP